MSKKVKGMIRDHLKSRFDGLSECAVVSLRGVSGTENNEMRGLLKEKQISMTVVKNSLAKQETDES